MFKILIILSYRIFLFSCKHPERVILESYSNNIKWYKLRCKCLLFLGGFYIAAVDGSAPRDPLMNMCMYPSEHEASSQLLF